MLKLASLKASSHLRNSHATFNGGCSEMRNIQRPEVRNKSCRWMLALGSSFTPAAFLLPLLLSCPGVQSALPVHIAATSVCLSTGWHSPNNFAIQTAQVSVRLLYACASCAQENVFSGHCCCSFRLLLVPQWCCSDPR